MDLSSINKFNSLNNVSFQGQKTIVNSKGKLSARITAPYIELKDGEEIGLEIVKINVSEKDLKPIFNIAGAKRIKIDDEEFKKGQKNYIDLDLAKHRLDFCDEFGYRYVVLDKNGKEVKSYTDSTGTVIDYDKKKYSIASTRQGAPRLGGPMAHIFTDSYNVTGLADKDNFRRTHVNRAGGTIQGIIEKLENELSSSRYIMTTPLIGGGKLASHMYHPANHFKVSEGTGDKADFLNLQTACFDNGKGYVLDGAFTSQGYEGLQLSHVLKREDSPFKYWFKNLGDTISLGVLSDDEEVHNKYTGYRIVNPKGVNGYTYDPSKPTYIQFYDKRLASKEQLENYGELIEAYDIKNTDDPYEITTWNDAIPNNYFEVDPKEYIGKTYQSLSELKETNEYSSFIDPKGKTYKFTSRGNSGGTVGWDGNIDLVKMNLSNNSSNPELIRGNKQAKNHMYNVARYWTEETRNALIHHIANQIPDNKAKQNEFLDNIEKKFGLEAGSLKSIDLNDYNYKIGKDKRSATKAIQEEILNFPLESLDFSPELLAVLSTPYITPRPTAKSNPAASKLTILNDAKNDNQLSKQAISIYEEHLPKLVKIALSSMQADSENGEKFFEGTTAENIGELTPYGKYFLELTINEMMNFFITEALFDEDATPTFDKGTISYTNDAKELTLNKLGELRLKRNPILNSSSMSENSSSEEAKSVAIELEKGLKRLTKAIEENNCDDFDKFKGFLKDKYGSISLNKYKLAEAITLQTGAGLNWRFDAAKDVADWGEYQALKDAEKPWDDVIDFWTPFVKTVKDINPSTYTIAEVTSLWDYKNGQGMSNWGKYGAPNPNEAPNLAESMFYSQTGATTGSNYSTYFGLYPKLFGKNIEEGSIDNFRSIYNFLNRTKGFIQPSNSSMGRVAPEFIIGSHVFLDNHDKPRASHLMGVDAELFWSNFKNNNDKERAEKVLGRKYSDDMSSKAVAVAEEYIKYFEELKNPENKKGGITEDEFETIKKAIQHLANGRKYKSADETPNFKKAEAFGNTPFEITLPHVIEQASAMGLKMDDNKKNNIVNAVFEKMVAPYESKMVAIYELMTGTVGTPTLFAGDELAQTGSEMKSKNWALGCRNIVRHDWLDDRNKQHVINFNTRLNQIASLRKTRQMSALADGTPIVIGAKKNEPVIETATMDQIIEGLKIVWDGDKSNIIGDESACSFLKCGKNKDTSFEQIKKELKTMPEKEAKEALEKQFKKIHPGKADWVLSNIKKQIGAKIIPATETGAIYKYNDKNSGVLTVITNAYMPKNPENITGLTQKPDKESTTPKYSDLTLVDDQGKLIAKPGTIFVEKAYSKNDEKYVDGRKFILNKNGKLKALDNKGDEINSTVSYLCKENKQPSQPYTNHPKLIG